MNPRLLCQTCIICCHVPVLTLHSCCHHTFPAQVDVARHMGQSLNVIHLVEAFEDDVCVDLVMELASGGSLWSRVKQGSYSEATAAR